MDADDLEELNTLKKCINDIDDQEDEIVARKSMTEDNLVGEKPMCFFCKLNRKMKNVVQFDTLVVKEKNIIDEEQERIVTDQKTIEWEVKKLYRQLYRKQEVEINSKEMRSMTGHIKKTSNAEKARWEQSKCLKNTRNNIAPGCGGFLGAYYKVF